MRSKHLLLVCALALPIRVAAQFLDDFEDGDLNTNPTWTGDLEFWDIEQLPSGRRLVSRGPVRSDTLRLTTHGTLAYGTWALRYGYTGGALSNFNQVRIILWTTADAGPSYYLLVGSNDRTLKLYRQASPEASRELLGSGADDILGGDSAAVHIRIERSYGGPWTIWLDGVPIIEFDRPASEVVAAGTFGLWVKHSSSRGSDHWFDDVGHSPALQSDTTPPRIEFLRVKDRSTLRVGFDEKVTTASACAAVAYRLLTADVMLEPVCDTNPVLDSLDLVASQDFPPGSHSLTVSGVADPSANILQDAVLDFEIVDLGRPPQRGDLVINEIDFDPIDSDAEFVEVLNVSNTRLDFSRVTIADASRAVPIASGPLSVDVGQFAVFTADARRFHERFPLTDASEVSGFPPLNNGGDTVMLLAGGDTLDAVSYAPPPGYGGGSLERVDPARPSDLDPNWQISTASEGATPGRTNSVFQPDLIGPRLLFVEQTSPVALRAVFDEPLPNWSVQPDMFLLSEHRPSVVSPAQPRYSADFFLAFANVAAGVLEATGATDAARNTTPSSAAAVHLLPEPGRLIINEVMFEPRADEFDGLDDQVEYVELRNIEAQPVTLNGCMLEGPEDESGDADAQPLQTADRGLAAGGLSLVVDADARSRAPAFLFQVLDGTMWPLDTGRLRLNNTGSRIVLSCHGEPIDTARFHPDFHHPAVAETRGVALERISSLVSGDDPRSWTSSLDPSGGTPGRSNSVAGEETTPEERLVAEPSPFAPEPDGHRDATTISYRLRSDRSVVRLTIYNARGRAVRHLLRGRPSPRSTSIVWDGRDDRGHLVATGIYVIFLEATDASEGFVERHKAAVVAVRGFN